jgi:hypothetical protein
MDYSDQSSGPNADLAADPAPDEDLYSFEFWDEQIEAALKDEDYKKFLDQGDKTLDRYLDKRDTAYFTRTSLNLFHANVTTLQSMLFGQTPKVDVNRRHDDAGDDVGRVATLILQRMLNNQIGLRTDTTAASMKKALTDYLTVGLGNVRVRYEATFEASEPLPETEEQGDEKIETLVGEDAPLEYVYWKDFLWKPARCWEETDWIAFRSSLEKEQVEERFGEEVANEIEYKSTKLSDNDVQHNKGKSADVWEIWCKKSRHVYWYVKGHTKLLDRKPDPLKLWGFYPCPQPMMANLTTRKMVPKADFVFAQDLYNEVDDIESRIMTLTKAVKVVGVYDKSAVGVQRMLQEGVENDLIPVDNWAMFAEKGGIKGQVDWLPIEAVVNAIQTLTVQRDQAINLLYQMTGMSDILRGQSTEGRTSATEQSLKAKFASTRIQFWQDMFAFFASDLQILRTDVIATHFDPMTIVKQSNIQFDEADQQYIQPAIQLIKDEKSLIWRIEVRPESVAMVDYAQLKQERTEYIMALSQFMQSAAPIMEQEPSSKPFLLELLKWGLAGFKGSQVIEGVMDKAIVAATQAAQQPQPDPEQEAKAQELQQKQMEFQQKMQAELQKAQMDGQLAQQKAQLEQQKMQMEMQQSRVEFQQQMELMNREFQIKMAELNAEVSALREKSALEARSLELKAEAQEEAAETEE